MKIPIIDTRNTIYEQLRKIKDERQECLKEYFNYEFYRTQEREKLAKLKNKMHLEALDLLTATLNLVHMLNIPKDVQEEHRQKMLTYEHDVSRMYKIIKWVDINLEGETE